MEASRIIMLSSGAKMNFNDHFVGWLTKQCLEYNILHPSIVNKIMELKLQYDVTNRLKKKLTKCDMDEILQWLRRVLYEKAQMYMSRKDGIESAPDWLVQAATRLRLLPAEQLPQPAADVVLSSQATSALLRRVREARGVLADPLLQVIWEDVKRAAMAKLDLLVKQGDRLSVGSSVITITDIEWRVIDMVLLDSSSDECLLVIKDSSEWSVQQAPLAWLCELAQQHGLQQCAGRGELARRWGRAHHAYVSKGFYLSLVALQRRWFELRRCPREWPQWELATRVQQLAHDSPAASFSWADLVGGGMVFTQQDAIESEIINATPRWKLNCGPRVLREEDDDSASVDISRDSTVLNQDDDVNHSEINGYTEKQTPSTTFANGKELPRKTSRFSSFLVFESDDEELVSDDNIEDNADSPAKDDSEEDVISLSEAILRIESDAVTAKRPKLAIHSISTTFDPNITMFSAPNSLEIIVPPADADLNTPPTVSLPEENIKQENEDSESARLYSNIEFTKKYSCLPDVPPPKDCVVFDEVIDQKLLMNAEVVLERMDIKKYMDKRRSAKKKSKLSKSVYVVEDDTSWRDSGSEWSPESAEESAGWSSEEARGAAEALRPVTLRDIDEVRRRAQRKLTAQVAPVTPAATAPAIDALLQENSGQDNACAPPADGTSPVVVEVREYCPLGLKATRLRYGQGMYRREMAAAAAADRRRARSQVIKRAREKRRRKKALRDCEEAARAPEGRAQDDDMREWIRQRNLNSRYFGPKAAFLPNPQVVDQRRSSNPTAGVDKPALDYRARASSLGREALPTILASDQNNTMPIVESHYPSLTNAFIPTSQMLSDVTSPHTPSGVIHIVPTSVEQSATSLPATQPCNGTIPQQEVNILTDESGASRLRLLLTLPVAPDPVRVPTNCAALWPVLVLSAQSKSDESKEVRDDDVVNIDDDSSNQSPHKEICSEKVKSEVVENATKSGGRKTLTRPAYNTETPPPLVMLTPKNTDTLIPENAVFGNMNTVTAQEYIQDEDGSRLKVICKHKSSPFWVFADEYLVLAEKFDEMKARNMVYYTLAPPNEIKRIIFDTSVSGGPPVPTGAGVAGAAAAGGAASSAPLRLAVQGKLYRKLSSAPLRYAQVLYAVRCAQDAQRISRRGGALLLYHIHRRYLTPLQHLDQLLTNHTEGPTEEIVIED